MTVSQAYAMIAALALSVRAGLYVIKRQVSVSLRNAHRVRERATVLMGVIVYAMLIKISPRAA